MAGQYPYGNPQYPPPQNQIYPQMYNPSNAPPNQAAPGQGYPGQNPQYPYQQGFGFYPGQAPGQHPAGLSYPGGVNVTPTAPGNAPTQTVPAPGFGYPGYPTVTPTQQTPVEWIPTNPRSASTLSNKAIVAGFEGYDGSPIWVIRARYEGDLIPGKLAVKHQAAYVPWGGKENAVESIEVCCANPERVRWVESRDGAVPPNAVIGGNTASGEPLYVGRAREQGSLTPGKIHQSHRNMYISFAGKEIPHNTYEVLCTV